MNSETAILIARIQRSIEESLDNEIKKMKASSDKPRILIVDSEVDSEVMQQIVARATNMGLEVIISDDIPEKKEPESPVFDIEDLIKLADYRKEMEPSRPRRNVANDRKRQKEDFRRQKRKFK